MDTSADLFFNKRTLNVSVQLILIQKLLINVSDTFILKHKIVRKDYFPIYIILFVLEAYIQSYDNY